MRSAVELADTCSALAQDAFDHLQSSWSGPDGVGGRDFYGVAFGSWLAAELGRQDEPAPRRWAAETAARVDRSDDGTFHEEFVRFAERMRELRLDPHDEGRPTGPRRRAHPRAYAMGRAANWRLLRASCRLADGSSRQRALGYLELASVLALNLRRGGFMEDQRGLPSMQYHNFCSALLGLIAREYAPSLRPLWLRTVRAIHETRSPSGDVNYLGRGSFQSFGYAAALATLGQAYTETGDSEHLRLLGQIVDRIAENRCSDGGIPLVLGAASGAPAVDEQAPGWWSYNNASDYEAFTAAWLAWTANELRRGHRSAPTAPTVEPLGEWPSACGLEGRDRPFWHVWGVVRRTTAGSQPFPYAEGAGQGGLVTYGGEERASRRYGWDSLPLPAVNGVRLSGDGRWSMRPGCLSLDRKDCGFERRVAEAGLQLEVADVVRPAVDGTVSWRYTFDAEAGYQQLSPTLFRIGDFTVESDVPLDVGSMEFWWAKGRILVLDSAPVSVRRGSVVANNVRIRQEDV